MLRITVVSEKRAKGFEPSTFSLGSRLSTTENTVKQDDSEPSQLTASHSASSCEEQATVQGPAATDLATLMAAWVSLPPQMRQAILLLIKSGGAQGQ